MLVIFTEYNVERKFFGLTTFASYFTGFVHMS